MSLRTSILFTVMIMARHMPARAAEDPSQKINKKAAAALRFNQSKGFNTEFCFLLDLSLPSGSNRFFVFDLHRNIIIDKGLVTQGHCNNFQAAPIRFSNTPGCGCSSSGKYRVGAPYKGKFGLAYHLAGLEATNSNAARRAVVLHSHSCVPARECYPQEICRSEGCTTVAPAFLKRINGLIAGSSKPILLWVYQ